MDGVIIIFHSLMIMPASLFFHRDEIKWCNDGFRLAAFQAKVIKYKFNIFVVRNCNWQDNWSIRHSNLCFMTIYTILWQFLTIFLSLLRHQVFKWLPLSVRWSVVQQRRFSSPNSWLFLKFTRYFKIFFPWHFCRVIWKIRPWLHGVHVWILLVTVTRHVIVTRNVTPDIGHGRGKHRSPGLMGTAATPGTSVVSKHLLV